MTLATPIEPPRTSSADQRIILHGVSWAEYEQVLAIRGDSGGVRMTYLQGELELMSPSMDHEGIKTSMARLLEAYAEERGIELNGFGSWTVRSAPKARGAEPDECYVIGAGKKKRPDLAIEVVWTSGGLDKLDVYRGLDVPEVWLHQAGKIQVYRLRGEEYAAIPKSELLPELDLELLARHIDPERQSAAVISYRRALR